MPFDNAQPAPRQARQFDWQASTYEDQQNTCQACLTNVPHLSEDEDGDWVCEECFGLSRLDKFQVRSSREAA